jgi:ABC-type transport system involved in multi-copper enzyme maturation permease subunit
VTFLPIVARELRVASRRPVTYWVRSLSALSLVLVGVAVFLSMKEDAPKLLSTTLFASLTAAAGIFCLFSGVRSTADCISEEKREGTLGLLFLTDLKGYDVVLGKLAGTSLNSLYGLMAVMPLLAIPFLLGGVTPGEFARMGGVVVNTLFLSLAIGLCVSAFTKSSRTAVGATFFVIVLFAALFPAAGAILAHSMKEPFLLTVLLMPSAGFAFKTALASSYKVTPELFWWSMGVMHALAWLFLAISASVAPRSWQDKPPGAERLRWRQRWQMWSYGDLAQRLAFRRELLHSNAFYWLSARARFKPALVWATLGLLGCGWLWGLAKFRHDWLDTGFYICTALVLNILIKLWFASESGRQFVEERKQGSLELVLSTSLTVPEILRGQRLALQRQFLGPLIFILGVWVLLMFATTDSLRTEVPDVGFWILLWLGGMVVLLADLAALYWVGMWQALVAKRPNHAASATVMRILVLPWLAFIAVCILMPFARDFPFDNPGSFLFGVWFVFSLAVDIGFGVRARNKLLSQFRLVAAQRYNPRASILKRLFVKGEVIARAPLQPARIDT